MFRRLASNSAIPLKAIAVGAFFLMVPLAAQETVPAATAMARVAKKVAPEYPPAAKQLNVSGSQEVQITVTASGDVEEAKVLRGNAMFTLATLNAVKQWKFQPLVKDGTAQPFTTVITINYQK